MRVTAVDDSGRRCVATTPIHRETLADHLDPTDQRVVVVPAVEQSRPDWLANDEGAARERAQDVGETVAAVAPADAETIEVKPDSATPAVLDAIAEHDPDRVVAVVREGGDATWLEHGDEISGEIGGVPVARVTVPAQH